MKEKTDPTKDPEFQKVVQRFLKSPPKPRKPKSPVTIDKDKKSGKREGKK